MIKRVQIISLFLGLWLCSCQTQANNPQGETKPKVVSTSTIIADLTTSIGGDEIEHTGILKPGTDPHVYEPIPKDSAAFEQADLILYNGYNLEPGLIRIMNAAGVKAKKVPVGEVVTSLEITKKGQIVPDPHVWGSAENGIKMVNAIRDQLIEISPEDQEKFTNNAAKLTQELEQLHSWIKEQIKTLPESQRQLVTTHDAFQYYANAYGLTMLGTLIGISTEEQPSAQTVKNLAEAIKKTGIKAIFAETTINPTLINTVAEESGVKLAPQKLYSDSIGAKGGDGDTYVKMLESNTKSIVEALGGNYQPFREKMPK